MIKSIIDQDSAGKNTGSTLGIMLIMSLALSSSLIAGTYSGGSGTSGDPYQISNTADLIELSKTSGDWSKYFIQTADISFNADESQVDWDDDGTATWDADDQLGFSPIGNSTTKFTGSYDGGGYTIDNLFINRPSTENVGFFGYTDRDWGQGRSYIRNLGLEDVNITGGVRIAGLVGRAMSDISYCYVTGSITGSAGNSAAAGITAQSHYPITDCYSTASVSAVYEAAGFVSYNNNSIDNCYSTGAVSNAATQDGFCNNYDGHGTGTITNSFWDTQTSGQTSSAGAATGKTTAQMKTLSTFTDAGWDFEIETTNGTNDYWDMDNSGSINNGYPFLSWQNGEDTSLPVELAAFTAENQSGGVLLKWVTESEIENLGFILSRRLKAQSLKWTEIASYLTNDALAGHGSTTQRHAYRYTDTTVEPGATYEYRLGDVDYRGNVIWHDAVEITLPVADAAIPATFGLQKAYPNPFNPAVTLQYDLTRDGETVLQVYNVRGQLVETPLSMFQTAGSYAFTWQPQNLNTGVYVVRLQSGKQHTLQKVVFIK